MDNLIKYNQIFMDSFSLKEEELEGNPTMEAVELWDSVGHVNLVATVEDTFGIEMTIEEMSEFVSYAKGLDILRGYGIEI